ncbi:MAG: flagellar hook-length control protein FliK [Gammaproteobacteria bacterium]|nr:flagellar hook-length control protein FliK [Gammaproteobacteria bacterium]
MSDSMPMMAGTGSSGTTAESTGPGASPTATSGEAFPALFDAQLESAGKKASQFPAELLQLNSAEQEMLSELPEAGNDLPPNAAIAGLPLIASTGEVVTSAGTAPLNAGVSSVAALSGMSKEVSDSLLTGKASEMAGRLPVGTTATALDASNSKTMAQGENSFDMMAGKENPLLMQMQGKAKAALLPELNAAQASQVDSLTQTQSGPGQNTSQNVSGTLAGLSMAGAGAKADIPTTTITIPPQNPAWNSAMGDRVQWMINQNISQAEIRLDPPELGALEVRIQVNKDQASVMFSAPNQQVRDAIEAAVPRLREMLSDMGLSLGDVGVSQESFAQSRESNEEGGSGAGQSTTEMVEGEIPVTEQPVVRGQGLIDAYA